MKEQLQAIGQLIQTAPLSPDSRHTVEWCLAKLPALCEQFAATYQTRFVEEIQRLELAILGMLAKTPDLAKAVLGQLEIFHQDLGLPAVPTPRVATPRVSTPRKKTA